MKVRIFSFWLQRIIQILLIVAFCAGLLNVGSIKYPAPSIARILSIIFVIVVLLLWFKHTKRPNS